LKAKPNRTEISFYTSTPSCRRQNKRNKRAGAYATHNLHATNWTDDPTN